MRLIRMAWLVFILAGCANVTKLQTDALVAYGEPLESDEPLFYSIGIDADRAAGTPLMDVFIELSPDAAPVRLKDLTVETVSQNMPRFIPPKEWPDQWKHRPPEMDEFEANGLYIAFSHRKLQRVGLCSHCYGGPATPVVGSAEGMMYTLPLTRAEVVAVFGEPDTDRQVREITY